MLKHLINFAKFRYGRGVMMPYWVVQPPSQGMFPKKTLSRSCNEYEVDEGKSSWHGVLDISRDHIVSSMGWMQCPTHWRPWKMNIALGKVTLALGRDFV
jgi:hypothetical protein